MRKSLAPSGLDTVKSGVCTSRKSFQANQFLVKLRNFERYITLSSTAFLLKSIYLCLYLISSFATSAYSSSSKGGVFERERIIRFLIIISISQDLRFLFSCHSGLALTIQVACITNSLLRVFASSQAVLSSSGSKTI